MMLCRAKHNSISAGKVCFCFHINIYKRTQRESERERERGGDADDDDYDDDEDDITYIGKYCCKYNYLGYAYLRKPR